MLIFGCFAFYRSVVNNNSQWGENKNDTSVLCTLIIINSFLYIILNTIITVLGDRMSKKQNETLRIIRKWINRNPDKDLIDLLEGSAARIFDSPVVISCFIFNFNMDLIGEVSILLSIILFKNKFVLVCLFEPHLPLHINSV